MYSVIVLLVAWTCLGGEYQVNVKAEKDSRPPHPHILFVIADDLGFNDVPWNNKHVVAPTLMNLATTNGVILSQSYAEPKCCPSRSAILSGRNPFEIGRQLSAIDRLMPTGLNTSLRLLPDYLRDLGYSTHAVGKWHLGFCKWEYTPTYRGFDTFRGFYLGSADYYFHCRNHGVDENENPLCAYDFRKNKEVDLTANGTYSADLFASTVEDILDSSNNSESKFIYLAFQNVHKPLQATEKSYQKYNHMNIDPQRKEFLAMITAMDEAMERVVTKLKETGHYEDTVIVFTSDNGGGTRFKGNNWPLRGDKPFLWEGGTKVPGFVHSPLLTSGGEMQELMHVTDWLPTLLRIANGTTPNDTSGFDQWDVVNGHTQKSLRREVVYSIRYEDPIMAAMRNERYKLIIGDIEGGVWVPPPESGETSSGINDTDIRSQFIYEGRIFTGRLYDLIDDPIERYDLSGNTSLRGILKELVERIFSFRSIYVPPDEVPGKTAGDPRFFNNIWSPGWC